MLFKHIHLILITFFPKQQIQRIFDSEPKRNIIEIRYNKAPHSEENIFILVGYIALPVIITVEATYFMRSGIAIGC